MLRNSQCFGMKLLNASCKILYIKLCKIERWILYILNPQIVLITFLVLRSYVLTYFRLLCHHNDHVGEQSSVGWMAAYQGF